MNFIYGPPLRPRKARAMKITCPIHGDALQLMDPDWTYCKNFGWHPTGEWWKEDKDASTG